MTPSLAASTRKKSYISVSVPTVLRGVAPVARCSIATAGASPSIFSKSGFGTWPTNCRAYGDRLST